MDVNIALMKWNNDNSTQKMYDEIAFCSYREWHLESGELIIDHWKLDPPKPTPKDLMKYSIKEIDEFKNLLDEIKEVKFQSQILITDNKEFLKNYAINGALIYESKTKKLFIFINNDWVKI